jgi:hypothetical protein
MENHLRYGEETTQKITYDMKRYYLGVVKKNPNLLAHPNLLTNCPTKLTYLINEQMDA